MLTLFPKFKTRLILFEGLFVALMAALYLLKPTTNLIAMILMLIVGCLFIAAAQYINAANTHSRQLNRLYNQLDVDGFLKEYEPHLQQNPKNPNLYMMVRLHLSNAYAAQGRFGDAMKLLAATEIREGKKPEQALMSRFAVTSNLCYCAEKIPRRAARLQEAARGDSGDEEAQAAHGVLLRAERPVREAALHRQMRHSGAQDAGAAEQHPAAPPHHHLAVDCASLTICWRMFSASRRFCSAR